MDPIGRSDGRSVSNHESLLERTFTALAMVATGLLCFIVTLTVVSRWIFRPLIPDDVLIVRELMVAVILLPLASVSARHAHIAVTFFTDLAGPRTRSVLERLGYFVGLLFTGALILAGSRLFMSAWSSGEYYDGDLYIPMWIGYATFLVALAAFGLRLAMLLFRGIAAPSSE